MTNKSNRVVLWDLTTRVFHWCFAISVSFMFYSGYTGEMMEWHIRAGQFVLALVVFRIFWGIVGSTPVRFATFVRSPVAALRHLGEFLNRRLPPEAGHNALGGYVVVAMLALAGLQAFSGLYMSDDIFLEGPLYATATEAMAGIMNDIHTMAWRGLGALVLLHPLAILAYRLWGGQNLLRPMLVGWMRWPAGMDAPVFRYASWWVGVVCALIAAAVVYGGVMFVKG